MQKSHAGNHTTRIHLVTTEFTTHETTAKSRNFAGARQQIPAHWHHAMRRNSQLHSCLNHAPSRRASHSPVSCSLCLTALHAAQPTRQARAERGSPLERAQGAHAARAQLSVGAAPGHGSGHHGLLLPVERVLGADRDEARPVGRARHRVHQELADGLDLDERVVAVAQVAVGLAASRGALDGQPLLPAWVKGAEGNGAAAEA